MGKTLYDKLWEAHVIRADGGGNCLLYIDRHLVHEVTSPQAFESLRLAGRPVWRKTSVAAVPDHNVPTVDRLNVADPVSRAQLKALEDNARYYDLNFFPISDERQGIVHIIGPEQGLTLPGMTIVCGDSHTSTHGAFGALAFGIGTSEVEHVLATQTLLARKSKTLLVRVDGRLGAGITAKDLALAIIGRVGTAGATGYTIEYAGEVIRALSMEGRMTLCNMSIEAGARAGLIAVDEKTIEYVRGRPFAPKGAIWRRALQAWRELRSDPDAHFDRVTILKGEDLTPQVSWGTSPEMVAAIDGCVPDPALEKDPCKAASLQSALSYMGLSPGTPITSIALDKIFIGSCTNGRIEDLRAAAQVLRGKKVAPTIRLAMAVPGSGLVKKQAEKEGLHVIFKSAGFEWREPGCSMCLAMNPDKLEPGERCASTSNRNFEGRQGHQGRTHLVSPAMAAAAAVAGHFVDIRGL